MIEVTETASKAIKEFMEEKNLDSALRVFMSSGG
jgi:Fe-S cluster assembly iron-binding protein IscA